MTEQDKIVVLQDNHRLRAENDTLCRERDEAIRERDEARKTCCGLWEKEDSGYITKKQLAADQGWDCYKEDRA